MSRVSCVPVAGVGCEGFGCLGVHAGSLSDRPAVSSTRPDLVGVSGRAQRAREAEQQPLPPASTARDHVTSPSPGSRSARLAVPQPSGCDRHEAAAAHRVTSRGVPAVPDWLGSPAPRAPTVARGLSSSPGRSRDGQPRSTTSASLASTTASGSRKCGWLAPTVNRSASCASRTRCVWPPRPTSTSSRWPRWPSLRSPSSWTSASSSTKPPSRRGKPARTRSTRSSRRSSSARRSTRTTTAPRRATSSGSSRRGDKVKVTIMFRGREQSRPELGFRLLQRLAEDIVELGFVESAPKQDGRNMIMVLGPTKKKAEAKAEQRRARSARPARAARAHARREQRDAARGRRRRPRPTSSPRPHAQAAAARPRPPPPPSRPAGSDPPERAQPRGTDRPRAPTDAATNTKEIGRPCRR